MASGTPRTWWLELMSKGLAAEQAVPVVLTFAHFECPKEEGRDYRIPDASRFREWGITPGPSSHYMAASLVRRSDHYLLAHDASTKGKLVHICQTAVTCVLKGSDGKEKVATVPLKFEICPSGTAAAGAQLSRDAPRCNVGRGQHAALLNAKSACMDHAALGTTDAIEVLKKGEVEKAAAAAALDDAAANPEVLRPAVEAWKKMTPAERECAAKPHKLGCTSHAVNLTTEDSHSKIEKQVIEENMVRARAARIITRLFHRWFYRVKVASLVTTKPLDVPTAAQYGGAYTRGGLKSSEPMAMDGSAYADKAVSWAAKYAGRNQVLERL